MKYFHSQSVLASVFRYLIYASIPYVFSDFQFDCTENGAPASEIVKFPYPDPALCQYFVYCVKRVPFVSVCPPLTYYHHEIKECDFIDNVPACRKKPPEEDQNWTIMPKDPQGNVVNDCSVRVSGRYPLLHGDCSRFVDCVHGKARKRRCNANLLFDIETMDCQVPDKARCWQPDTDDGAMTDYVEYDDVEDMRRRLPHGESPNQNLSSIISAEMYYIEGVFYKMDTDDSNSMLKGPKNAGEVDLFIVTAEEAEALLEKFGSSRFTPRKQLGGDQKPERKVAPHDEEDGAIVITSEVMKDDGEWMVWEGCPKGKYVNGIASFRRAKMVKGILDNVGIISVALQCVSPAGFGKTLEEIPPKEIIYWVAPDAPPTDVRFNKYYECTDGAVSVGFQLNQDPDHGPLDDMGTANIRLLCSFGEHAVKPYWTSDFQELSRIQGKWTGERYCKPQQAICGATTQMQKYVDHVNLTIHDNTGLNNMKIKCCDIPNPAMTCKPVEKEVKVAFCDNSKSRRTRACEFKGTIGTAYDYWRDEYEIYFYESVGFTRESQIAILSERFIKDMGYTGTYKWKGASSIIWKEDVTSIRRIFISPGWQTELYQIIAECGYYVVHTNRFFRLDSDLRNGRFTLQYFDLL